MKDRHYFLAFNLERATFILLLSAQTQFSLCSASVNPSNETVRDFSVMSSSVVFVIDH